MSAGIWTTQCWTNQMTYERLTTSSSLSCTLSLAVFQSLWQVWKGRRNFSVFGETRASINHICLWNVQILDIVSPPSSIFTLFECKCKPMCCHKSGLTLPTSSSNYWGRVQCHAHSYSFRLLRIQCHKQDFRAQVKICRAQNTHIRMQTHAWHYTESVIVTLRAAAGKDKNESACVNYTFV